MVEASRAVGPYELLERIGVGGMAEAFLAVRRGPGGFEQRVCLKRVLPAFAEDEEFIRLFMKEAQIAATLRHSNIVGLIDFGEHEGVPFLVLELIEGADLRYVLKECADSRLPLSLALLIANELARALHHAHSLSGIEHAAGVVHRDVSPSNVIVSSAGEIKLADFGIAKAITSTAVSTMIKGKVSYMAPEQALARPVDGRTDLFALGVILFEMLSGVRPFDGARDTETLSRLLSGTRPDLAQLVPDLPPQVVAVVDRLLQLDPDKRFRSAAECMTALAELPTPPVTARFDLGKLARQAHQTQQLARSRSRFARAEELRGATARRHSDRARDDAGRAESPRDPPGDSAEVVPAAPDADTRYAGESASSRSEPETRIARPTKDAEAAEPNPSEPLSSLEPDPPEPVPPRYAAREPAPSGFLTVGQPGTSEPRAALEPRRTASSLLWIGASVSIALAAIVASAVLFGTAGTRSDASNDGAPARADSEAARRAAGATSEPHGAPASPKRARALNQPVSGEPGREGPVSEPTEPATLVRTDTSIGEQGDSRHEPGSTAASTESDDNVDAVPTSANRRVAQPSHTRRISSTRNSAASRANKVLLTVQLNPWGEVWVDRHWMGRAPVTIRVDPGPHLIGYGTKAPIFTRRIYVPPGDPMSIELRLLHVPDKKPEEDANKQETGR